MCHGRLLIVYFREKASVAKAGCMVHVPGKKTLTHILHEVFLSRNLTTESDIFHCLYSRIFIEARKLRYAFLCCCGLLNAFIFRMIALKKKFYRSFGKQSNAITV